MELPMYMEIMLSQGLTALVDPEDYEGLSKYKWHVNAKIYVVRYYRANDGNHRTMYMHRQVMGCGEWPAQAPDIDHINHNKLDNRRSNLRFATESQNGGNMLVPRTNTSGFKGVSWHRQAGKWVAKIKFNGKWTYLGLFSDKRDAAVAYNRAAIEQWGEFALLNEVTYVS